MTENTSVPPILTLENYESFRTNAYVTIETYARKQKSTLPPGEVAFCRTVDPASALALERLSTKIKNKLNRLLVNADIPGTEMLGRVNDAKDFDIWFKDLVTMNDSLIDGVNASLDELTGRNQKFASSTADIPTSMVAQVRARSGDINIVYSRNITRPQAKFKDKIDNSGAPFIPKLPNKPNAIIPLKLGGIEEGSVYPHPYRYEITHLTYPSFIFEEKEPIQYRPLDDTPLIWVDTLEGLTAMCQKLESSQEIAVDLEHHDYRSYQGFTCLIQISTRDEDFIVDVLELRHHLHMLNNSFTNPNILKVFHGADYDITWLQKDFGVYVVNLFDTNQASHLLEMRFHSLAYLLKHYCHVDADKKFQLADWRLRPLTEEMINYARCDTHYLLYIYDRMRNELIQNSVTTTYNLLKVTLDRSAEISLQCYETFRYDPNGEGPNGYQKLLAKWNFPLNRQQLAVFKALHAWRDNKAREEDESLAYVLPNDILFTLSEKMPDDSKDITSLCRNIVPPLVRENTLELVSLITDAKNSVLNSTSNFDNKPVKTEREIRTVTSNSEPILNSKNIKWVLDTSHPKYNADDYKEKKSVLFGDFYIENGVNETSKKKVSEILSNLTFALPVLPKSISYHSNRTGPQPKPMDENSQPIILPVEHIYVPPEARSTKSKGKEREVVVLSQSISKKRQRLEDDDLIEDEKRLRRYDPYSPTATSSGNRNATISETFEIDGEANDDKDKKCSIM
ncbi:exosome complex exonuclease rrp6 [Gigaspora margarita]|uniref:Exosome complex exonuclease rrp6 n=1 Tax=Gigaspora margarita TaxID=4874 RepID=A0A8H4EN43_GIGMA|nr:exosome complex exonuclease rrp6 [Gigaspora margarita]